MLEMTDQTSRNYTSELVEGCVNGNQTETHVKNDIERDTTSPWKYPSFNSKKKGTSECSHKVIEKRRRDRINKCLADLGQIVPKAQTGKQGSGKLEKAEILELTVEYIRNTQRAANIAENATPAQNAHDQKAPDNDKAASTDKELQSYSKGYSDCTSEVLRFLVIVEATDPRIPCFQRLMAHLRNQCRHLINLPDHDTKQPSKHSKVVSSNTKANSNDKKTNLKSEFQDVPSAKRSRIDEGSPTTYNGKDKTGNFPLMGLLEENLNPMINKESRSVGSSSSSSSNGNSNSDSLGNNDINGNGNNFTAQYQNNSMPFSNHFYPPSYGFPTYALHPAGTHYIPVALHPGIQMPGNNAGGILPAATMINQGLGYFGSPMSGLSHTSQMGSGPPPSYRLLGNGLSYGSGLGGMGTGLGGMGLGVGSELSAGQAGPGGLPTYLSMAQKEQNRSKCPDSNGNSENESNSSSDEYNFSSSSSGNLSEIGIQTDLLQDHSDYFSAGSR